MRRTELLHKILKSCLKHCLCYLNYANLFKNHKKCYFSFICWPIWIFLVSSGRTTWGTQNFEILSQTLFMLKITKKMLLFLKKLTPFQCSTLPAGTYITHRVIYSFTCYAWDKDTCSQKVVLGKETCNEAVSFCLLYMFFL